MGVVVLPVKEVNVVRRYDADVQLRAEFQHAFRDADLSVVEFAELHPCLRRDVGARLGGVVQHDFEGICVAEEILVPAGRLLGKIHVALVDGPCDFARDACGRAVEAFVVLFKKAPVDSRVVVEPVYVRSRDELYEVAVTREVHRVQAQVVAAFVLVARREVASRCDVRLAPEDRLYMDLR